MNAIIGLGRYLFSLPFIVLGVNHFMSTSDLAPMAPGGEIVVYISGVALIAAGISILIGKMDKLAAVLLALLLLLFILPHAQMMSDDPSQLGNILKNIALAGGALVYASVAKDNSVIG